MLKLYGYGVSNYHNKVKLALMEKGIPFDEVAQGPSQDEAYLRRSPLGKIPLLETDEGPISESQAILEFLEDKYPAPPLYPPEPYARAKCREIIQHLELNVELVARRLYGAAFYGERVSDETKAEVKAKVEKGLAGFSRLVKFSPFAAGSEFSAADCAVWPHLGVVSRVWERLFAEDLLSKIPGSAEYLAMMGERSHVCRVAEDRAKAIETLARKAK